AEVDANPLRIAEGRGPAGGGAAVHREIRARARVLGRRRERRLAEREVRARRRRGGGGRRGRARGGGRRRGTAGGCGRGAGCGRDRERLRGGPVAAPLLELHVVGGGGGGHVQTFGAVARDQVIRAARLRHRLELLVRGAAARPELELGAVGGGR